MKELRFEWDPTKAEENLRKHGVSFPEAASVFCDEWAVETRNEARQYPR